MADIDLLLEIGGVEAANGNLNKFYQQMNRMHGQMLQGINSVRGLEGAFAAMSGNGELSIATLVQLTSILPALSNPVGILTTGIGGLAYVAVELYKGINQLDKELEEKKLSIFAAEASANMKKLNDQVKVYLDTIAQGGNQTAAFHAQRLEESKKEYENQYALITGLIAEDTELQRRAQLSADYAKNNFSRRMFQREADAYAKQIDFLQVKLEALAEGTGQVVTQTEAETAAINDAKQRLEEYEKVLSKFKSKSRPTLMDLSEQSMTGGFGEEAKADIANGIAVTDGLTEATVRAIEESLAMRSVFGETFASIGAAAKQEVEGATVGAFNAYADALDKTVSLNNIFAGGFDRAMRNIAASSIRSIGQRAAIDGSYETAKAIGALANQDYAGAATHAEAAGLYFGVAAAAGVAAGALSVNAPGAGGGGGSGSGGGGGGSSFGGGDTVTVHVTVIGTLDDAQAEDLHNQIQGAVRRRDLN